jgi:ABC-type transporter Mla subunit MlaD
VRAGDECKGSPVYAALKRLKQLHAMVNAGQRLPSAAWQQLDQDLRTLVDSAQQRQKLQQQVDVNIQKHEQEMFRRLAQLQQHLQHQHSR